MQVSSIFNVLFMATAAIACAQGPYDTGSGCGGSCVGVTRCGDENHVIQCTNGVWTAVQACGHCKNGACTS